MIITNKYSSGDHFEDNTLMKSDGKYKSVVITKS